MYCGICSSCNKKPVDKIGFCKFYRVWVELDEICEDVAIRLK